jgi:hypothetical protein
VGWGIAFYADDDLFQPVFDLLYPCDQTNFILVTPERTCVGAWFRNGWPANQDAPHLILYLMGYSRSH